MRAGCSNVTAINSISYLSESANYAVIQVRYQLLPRSQSDPKSLAPFLHQPSAIFHGDFSKILFCFRSKASIRSYSRRRGLTSPLD